MSEDKIVNSFDVVPGSKLEKAIKKQDELFKQIAEPLPALRKLMEPSSVFTAFQDIPKSNSTSMGIKAFEASPALAAVQSGFEPMFETQRMIQQMVEPLQIAANLSPAIEIVAEYRRNQAALLASTVINVMASSLEKLTTAFETSIMNWFKDGINSPIIGVLNELSIWIPRDFDSHHFNQIYLSEMYDARWFPYLGWNADLNLAREILDIIYSTRKSKNRERQIDKAVFTYYAKKEIENIRKSWRELEIPAFRVKILNQAVKAYYRKEYALTVSTLVSMWEGIIAQKTNVRDDYRISRKTRQSLTKLIEINNFGEIFSSYCEEFIFYNCTKPEDVKPDVPGRHEIAHSWYDKYPNRKIALNAILFTDFLLKLEPLPQQE